MYSNGVHIYFQICCMWISVAREHRKRSETSTLPRIPISELINCFLGTKYHRAICFILFWTNCRWQHRPAGNILNNSLTLWNTDPLHRLIIVPIIEQIPPTPAFEVHCLQGQEGERSEIQRSNKVGKIVSLLFILKERMQWKAAQVMFTRDCHRSLSWARWIPSTTP